MTRWRLVTQQGDGPPEVSTVVMGRDEIAEQLAAEEFLHSLGGWAVVRDGDDQITCFKIVGPGSGTVRRIRAVEFDAMHDHASYEEQPS